MSRFWLVAFLVSLFAGPGSISVIAQSEQLDGEMKRLQGNWRVVELVENGQSIPQDQMNSLLPGGGLVEIVDATMLFKSPVDGHKSTKSFRIDSSSYPKKIAIFDLDRMTGQGIFEHDSGKLVICVSHPPAAVPTDLSAPAGSSRTMLVLVRYNESSPEIQKLNLGAPPAPRVTPRRLPRFPIRRPNRFPFPRSRRSHSPFPSPINPPPVVFSPTTRSRPCCRTVGANGDSMTVPG